MCTGKDKSPLYIEFGVSWGMLNCRAYPGNLGKVVCVVGGHGADALENTCSSKIVHGVERIKRKGELVLSLDLPYSLLAVCGIGVVEKVAGKECCPLPVIFGIVWLKFCCLCRFCDRIF